MTSWVAKVGVTFKSVDWFVPPYMKGGVIRKLAVDIDSAPTDSKHLALEMGLRRMYSPRYLAAMFLERYRKVDPVRDFAIPIREGIEASAFGLDHAAVATVLPVLEGVLRRLAIAGGRDLGNGTRKLVDEIERRAEHERRALAQAGGETVIANGGLVERIDMLEQLRDFMRDRLLVGTNKYTGIDELNRHGILHGVFGNYGVETNFQKLVSFLDGLVFSIAPSLAPDETTESRRFATYLNELSGMRKLRPTFGDGSG